MPVMVSACEDTITHLTKNQIVFLGGIGFWRVIFPFRTGITGPSFQLFMFWSFQFGWNELQTRLGQR